jgi:4-oxalocrotonate tautomerase
VLQQVRLELEAGVVGTQVDAHARQSPRPGKMTRMPLVEVTLVEGRTAEQLRTLISRLTAAVVDSVGAPKENVRVVLREVPATHWAAGDVTIAERRG